MYLADTNVYLDAGCDVAFARQFADFIEERGPLAVSSIVAAEVVLGTRRAAHRGNVAQAVSILGLPSAPNHQDWALAALAVARLEQAGSKSRSFWNDALLAAQCARLGLTLITSNQADFRRLQREIAVRTVAPFPA